MVAATGICLVAVGCALWFFLLREAGDPLPSVAVAVAGKDAPPRVEAAALSGDAQRWQEERRTQQRAALLRTWHDQDAATTQRHAALRQLGRESGDRRDIRDLLLETVDAQDRPSADRLVAMDVLLWSIAVEPATVEPWLRRIEGSRWRDPAEQVWAEQSLATWRTGKRSPAGHRLLPLPITPDLRGASVSPAQIAAAPAPAPIAPPPTSAATAPPRWRDDAIAMLVAIQDGRLDEAAEKGEALPAEHRSTPATIRNAVAELPSILIAHQEQVIAGLRTRQQGGGTKTDDLVPESIDDKGIHSANWDGRIRVSRRWAQIPTSEQCALVAGIAPDSLDPGQRRALALAALVCGGAMEALPTDDAVRISLHAISAMREAKIDEQLRSLVGGRGESGASAIMPGTGSSITRP